MSRLQRPSGKLQWVTTIWKSLERCVALLDNSQAIKASSSLPDETKSAEMLFLFNELLPPMATYFGNYFRSDRADVDDGEKRRILNLATRLLRGVHGLCHPPPGPECGLTDDDMVLADVTLHQMLENGLRSGRPLSAGHNSAIEKDARRGAACLKKEPAILPKPPPSYARLVQQLLAVAAREQPTLGIDEDGTATAEVDSDEEAAAAADKMVAKFGNDLSQVGKRNVGIDLRPAWTPIEQEKEEVQEEEEVQESLSPSSPVANRPAGELLLNLDTVDMQSPSPESAAKSNARRRVVNVGDGGSTPKEVRTFMPDSDDEEDNISGDPNGDHGAGHAWEILAGGCALDKDGSVEATETMRGSCDLVGLYFGGGPQKAEWACRSFEDEMRELYEAGGCDFEVLSCSANLMETEQAFLERQQELPWRTLPYGDPRPPALAKLFGIENADGPVLVFIDQDGEILSKNGVAEVRALLHDWRVQVAVLEGEAGLRAAGILVEGTEGVANESEASATSRPTTWHERGEGAVFGAYFAFRRGEQLGVENHFDSDGGAVASENRERLGRGIEAAQRALPPLLLDKLPCSVGGWTIATRSLGGVAADSSDDADRLSATTNSNSTSSRGATDGMYEGEGGRVLLLSHGRTGTQLAVWEDAAGFFFRRASDTSAAMCLGPQCSVPTAVDKLREGGGDGGPGGAHMLSEYDVFIPTLPEPQEFFSLCSASGRSDTLPGGSYSWGTDLHVPNDSVPWVLSVSEDDGSLLLADYAHTGGGALFLTSDGGMAFGSETATALVQPSTLLPSAGWTQRRLSVLLDRARELSVATPDGFGAFAATHAITQGLSLDQKHEGLANALEVLATSAETAVSNLELLPSRRGSWGLAEIEEEMQADNSGSDSGEHSTSLKRLALVHTVSGARVTLGDQGGVHYRYAPTGSAADPISASWERWFSDEGWQDQSGTIGRNAMPDEAELAAAQFAAQSSATPVLPQPGRFAWSATPTTGMNENGATAARAVDTAGWGLQVEDTGGMTIAHVKGWLRAWMFGERASCLRLTSDGGVVATDTEGGWTGLCITEEVVALGQNQGLNFLRLAGSPCIAAGWSIGVAGRSESTTAMPSISGLLLFSHKDSGARLALREYDHAFFFTDSTAAPPTPAVDDESNGEASATSGATSGGMLWSMQGASSDDEDGNSALDRMGGIDGGFAGLGFTDGAPADSQFESIEQHAKQLLPSSNYSWPGPPSVPDTWSIMLNTQCDETNATVSLMYVGEAEVGTGPGPFQIILCENGDVRVDEGGGDRPADTAQQWQLCQPA